MTFVAERPVLIGVLGLIAVAVVGYAWLQTQHKQLLQAAIAIVVVTIGLLVASRWVTTDRERVDAALHGAALAVQRNDLAALLRFIHPAAPEIRAQAEAEFPRYEFHEVSIKSNLEITVDSATDATAKFNVVVTASERDGLVKNWKAPRYCTVRFRKDGDAWKVVAYEHHDAQEGLLRKK